MIVVNMY